MDAATASLLNVVNPQVILTRFPTRESTGMRSGHVLLASDSRWHQMAARSFQEMQHRGLFPLGPVFFYLKNALSCYENHRLNNSVSHYIHLKDRSARGWALGELFMCLKVVAFF